jgi:hypothetical protein
MKLGSHSAHQTLVARIQALKGDKGVYYDEALLG